MLQERAPVGVTVELVQSVTIALLVLFLAVAVVAVAVLGWALGKAKVSAASLRAWYADIATKRVINDRERRTRPPDVPPPDTLKSVPPPQPMRLAETPRPPPLPTVPIVAVGPAHAPVPPRPKRRLPRLELAQTSPDWSDDGRATAKFPRPGKDLPGDAVQPEQLDFSDAAPPSSRR